MSDITGLDLQTLTWIVGMYEMRDKVKVLCGDYYPARIAQAQDILRDAMKTYECDEFDALLHLFRFAKETSLTDAELFKAMAVAACVETLEANK